MSRGKPEKNQMEGSPMRKSAYAGLAIVFCLPAFALAQQSPEQVAPVSQAPTLSPRTEPAPPVDAGEGRIHLDVVVTDKAGKAIPGLELKDFTLLDDNRPGKILSFHAIDPVAQAASRPVEVVLLLDAVNLGFQTVSQMRNQISRFLRENGGHLSQPVSILVFHDDGVKVLAQPSTDGNALATQLDNADSQIRIINRSSQYSGFDRFDLSLKWVSMIAQAEVKRPGKKLLIWAGEGWPQLDRPSIEVSNKEQQQLFQEIVYLSTALREGHMSLYSVSLGDPHLGTFIYQDYLKGVKTAEKANPTNLTLKVFAIETGGRVAGPDNDIAAQIGKCVQDAGAFYTISFDPPKADRANEYHDLKVQVDQPGLTARTSTGYYNQP
jgi:VWFA-related protein